jgi:hypothetical protein
MSRNGIPALRAMTFFYSRSGASSLGVKFVFLDIFAFIDAKFRDFIENKLPSLQEKFPHISFHCKFVGNSHPFIRGFTF